MKFKQLVMAVVLPLMLSFVSVAGFAETRCSEINKLADYLYFVTFHDYDYADYLSVRRAFMKNPNFGCTVVHNGDFVGRNFDSSFDEVSQYVVYVPAGEKRYSSIGMAYPIARTPADKMNDITYIALPWFMVDGINENGVSVSVNTCPSQDLEFYIAKGGTNFGKPDVDISTVVRFLLDRATSAEQAVELLRKVNIINDLEYRGNYAGTGIGFHFMIADRDEQYIVEFIANQLSVTKTDPIMTNFFNTLLPRYTDHSTGVERYDYLKTKYINSGKGMDEMLALMRLAVYSDGYNVCTHPVRYTDMGIGYDPALETDVTYNMIKKDDKVRSHIKDVMSKTRAARNVPGIMHTNSTSIYDLRNLTMRLYVQENYDKSFEFMLSK